jgi:hypothetical protein
MRVYIAANYIDPSLNILQKKTRLSKRYYQDVNDRQDDNHSGLTMRGYSPAICHQVYTLGEGLLSLSGHASTGRGRGVRSSP